MREPSIPVLCVRVAEMPEPACSTSLVEKCSRCQEAVWVSSSSLEIVRDYGWPIVCTSCHAGRPWDDPSLEPVGVVYATDFRDGGDMKEMWIKADGTLIDVMTAAFGTKCLEAWRTGGEDHDGKRPFQWTEEQRIMAAQSWVWEAPYGQRAAWWLWVDPDGTVLLFAKPGVKVQLHSVG